MIGIKQKGDFKNTYRFLNRAKNSLNTVDFDRYGREGVKALSSATPVDTGETASSWYYEVIKENGSVTISFCNSNVQNNVPIAIILQYGHGTNNGGWVQGRDYINPAIQPIFDDLANNAWKEVTKS